jgi:phage tail tape-measure protein
MQPFNKTLKENEEKLREKRTIDAQNTLQPSLTRMRIEYFEKLKKTAKKKKKMRQKKVLCIVCYKRKTVYFLLS